MIKLHSMSGDVVYVNEDHILKITNINYNEKGSILQFAIYESKLLIIKESPEEILLLIDYPVEEVGVGFSNEKFGDNFGSES